MDGSESRLGAAKLKFQADFDRYIEAQFDVFFRSPVLAEKMREAGIPRTVKTLEFIRWVLCQRVGESIDFMAKMLKNNDRRPIHQR